MFYVLGWKLLLASSLPNFLIQRQLRNEVSFDYSFGKFALFILEHFQPNLIGIVHDSIINSSNLKRFNPCSKEFAIALFSNITFPFCGEGAPQPNKETTLRNLLSSEGHLFLIFTKYQNCDFIELLVKKLYNVALKLNSEKYLTTFYFIKRLPGLKPLLDAFALRPPPFDERKLFIETCKLFLNYSLELENEIEILSGVEKELHRIITLKFAESFFGVTCPNIKHSRIQFFFQEHEFLNLLTFSPDEVSFSISLIHHIREGKKLNLPKNEEFKGLLSKETCILKGFALNAENIHVKRIGACISRLSKTVLFTEFKIRLIPSLLERIHLLKDLSSLILWKVVKYFTMEYWQTSLDDDYSLFSQQSPSHKLDLNRFIGVKDDIGGFLSTDERAVKESIICLGTNVPIFNLAKLLVPLLADPNLSYRGFLDSLGKEKIKNPLLSESLNWSLFLYSSGSPRIYSYITFEHFLRREDICKDVFSVFAHKVKLGFTTSHHRFLVYYLSRLLDDRYLPGSGPLIEFLLLNFRSSFALKKFLINLYAAGNSHPFDFDYLFRLLTRRDHQTLTLVLSPEEDFGEWCRYLLESLERKATDRSLQRIFNQEEPRNLLKRSLSE
jgi:hypothetical protein